MYRLPLIHIRNPSPLLLCATGDADNSSVDTEEKETVASTGQEEEEVEEEEQKKEKEEREKNNFFVRSILNPKSYFHVHSPHN